jgi:hypothetical protein
MKVSAIRIYGNSLDGLQSLGEVWAKKLDSELSRKLPVPKKITSSLDDFKEEDVEDRRRTSRTSD